jgi:putative membrane protein
MMWGDHWMYGGFMWIVWVAVIIGLIWLVTWIAKQAKSSGTAQNEHPLEILRRRYAKGEIDKEEFEQKRKDLTT